MKVKRERSRKRRRWGLRTLPVLVALFVRLFAVILTVQTSGAAHGAVDLIEAALGNTVDHEDCSGEGTDDNCPPGCPNCHCSHGGATVIPHSSLALHVSHPPHDIAWTQGHTTETPPAPLLSPVYRPPKAITALGG